MNRHLRFLIATTVVLSASINLAQEPAAAPAAPTTSDDPAVQALLDSKPSTPDDLMNVIGLLIDLNQPVFGKALVQKLDQAVTDDDQLNALGRKYGSRFVSRIATVPELQPEGKALAEKIRTAMANVARDPQRIAGLIGRLQDPSLDVRAAAINNLRLGGDVAVQMLVDAVLQAPTPADRQAAEIGLAGMAEAALGPVGAMLVSGDEAATAAAVRILALIDDAAVLNDLYIAAFSPAIPAPIRAQAEAALARRFTKAVLPVEAAGRLYLAAEGLYKKQPNPDAPQATVWSWDTAAKKPVAATMPARLDELRRAARYAAAANAIGGNDPTVRKLSRAAALEALILGVPDGEDADPVINQWREAEKPSRAELEGLFELAAAHDRTRAAIWLLAMMKESASAEELLIGVGGRPTTLVRATSHPNRAIRFAATAWVPMLQPTFQFPGSSGVTESMAWFATGEGVDRALVVDPREARGRNLAGMLVEMNIRADSTADVREALTRAVTQADIQLILIDRTLLDPGQGNFLARLRADYRTARTPVVVLSDPDEIPSRPAVSADLAAERSVERLRSRLSNDPYTMVFIRPTKPEHFQKQFSLYPLPIPAEVPGLTRSDMAHQMLGDMRVFLGSKNPVFDLRPYERQLLAAAASPELSGSAIQVLMHFGSPAVQRTLVDTASANVRPLDVRQAAATAFEGNVMRFGTLLTTDEIRKQYDRYNASESLDRPTQELLGSILDTIEARAANAAPYTVKHARSAAAAAPKPAP